MGSLCVQESVSLVCFVALYLLVYTIHFLEVSLFTLSVMMLNDLP